MSAVFHNFVSQYKKIKIEEAGLDHFTKKSSRL